MLPLVHSLAEGEFADAKALKAKIGRERVGGGRWSRASIRALRQTAGTINPDSAGMWRPRRRRPAPRAARGFRCRWHDWFIRVSVSSQSRRQLPKN